MSSIGLAFWGLFPLAPTAHAPDIPGGLNDSKRKLYGGTLAFIGFMLSPLSWWNDAFVNIPLALAFAWGVALFHQPAFAPALIFGYWLTNLAGLLLMHQGAQQMLSHPKLPPPTARWWIKGLLISLGYTLLMVGLTKLKIFQPLTDYVRPR